LRFAERAWLGGTLKRTVSHSEQRNERQSASKKKVAGSEYIEWSGCTHAYTGARVHEMGRFGYVNVR